MITEKLIEVIFTLSRCMHSSMSFHSKVSHLSMLQLQVLIFLKKNPNAQMSEVAQKFRIELPSATSLVKKLYAIGLVQRKSDQKDKRQVLLTLTKQGVQILHDGMMERRKKIGKLLSYLSEKDKKKLLQILEKMVKEMQTYEK